MIAPLGKAHVYIINATYCYNNRFLTFLEINQNAPFQHHTLNFYPARADYTDLNRNRDVNRVLCAGECIRLRRFSVLRASYKF